MDEDVTSRYPVIISMLRNGVSLDQIPNLAGVTAEVWEAVQADDDFVAMLAEPVPSRNGVMTPEEVIARATQMTDTAFQALEDVINSPRATPTARLQAANTAFSWREELQNKKKEADARVVYHLHIDKRATERMQKMIDMFLSGEGKAWLREMSGVMPNSTA